MATALRLFFGRACALPSLQPSASGYNIVALAFRNHPVSSHRSVFSRRQHSLAAKRGHDVASETGVHGSAIDEPPLEDVDLTLPRFDSLKGVISAGTLEAIIRKPFNLTNMSPVQAEVLPLLPEIAQPYNPEPLPDGARPPRDLLVRAKTGTGKTLAFLVPAIEARLKSIDAFIKQAVADSGLTPSRAFEERIRRSFTREHVGTLIISPTRELATQIANEATRLCQHHAGMGVILFTGGVGKSQQMRDWMKTSRDIVVATPGRLRDLLMSNPGVAKGFSETKLLVLDETDTLLDIGFRDDIDAIKEFLPPTPQRQTFLFSATVSRSIQQVARSSLDPNHLFINTVTDNSSPVHAHVQQYHTVVPNASHQIPHVLRLLAHDQLSNPGKSKTIVFLPTTKMTKLFTTLLRGLSNTALPAGGRTNVYEIHSKRDQQARTRTSDSFRRDRSGAAILVSSDVSARGVDYPGVTRIIQVGIPGSTEQYVHRVGRTGRAGTAGRGDLVLLPWEIGFVSWQLVEMPLKPLTVGELTSQVQELAAQHDADPQSVSKNVPRQTLRAGATITRPPASVTSIVEDMDKKVSELVQNLDKDAVDETFTSLLGYYIPKSPELRVQKSVIVQGCKDWTVEACGLQMPPYVSEMFLRKLGASEPRTAHFGRGQYRSIRQGRPGYNWEGTSQRSKRSSPGWGSARDSEDDYGHAAENPSRKFGRSHFEDESNFGFRRSRGDSFGARREYGDSKSEGTFGSRENRGFGRRERQPQKRYGLSQGDDFQR